MTPLSPSPIQHSLPQVVWSALLLVDALLGYLEVSFSFAPVTSDCVLKVPSPSSPLTHTPHHRPRSPIHRHFVPKLPSPSSPLTHTPHHRPRSPIHRHFVPKLPSPSSPLTHTPHHRPRSPIHRHYVPKLPSPTNPASLHPYSLHTPCPFPAPLHFLFHPLFSVPRPPFPVAWERPRSSSSSSTPGPNSSCWAPRCALSLSNACAGPIHIYKQALAGPLSNAPPAGRHFSRFLAPPRTARASPPLNTSRPAPDTAGDPIGRAPQGMPI